MSGHKRTAFALCLSLSLAAGGALAVTPDERLEDPALEARARAISQELRCLVCQNQSIDDSNAPLAHDLRVIVRERILAGDTDAEVFGYVVDRYGDFVRLRPPMRWDTLALWFGPVLLFVGGLGLAALFIRTQRREAAGAAAPLTPEEEAALARALRKDAPSAD